jgi:hypothetical protein
VLSCTTVRSVWIENTQSKSLRPHLPNAVPFSEAGLANLRLNSAM